MAGGSNLKGLSSVVTGGSTHLGRAIAESLAAAGAVVYIASRDLERCEAVATEITMTHGTCRAAEVDVTDQSRLERLFSQVVEDTDRLDIVVANAGGPVSQTEEKLAANRAQETIRRNLFGSYLTATTAYPYMAIRRPGAIVLVGSIHGISGSDKRMYDGLAGFSRSQADYHAAKGGVIQLARSLACDYGPSGIRVNCVSPGIIATEAIPNELIHEVSERTPIGRIGHVDEVATVVRFLASPEASWITGQNIVVDGGFTLW